MLPLKHIKTSIFDGDSPIAMFTRGEFSMAGNAPPAPLGSGTEFSPGHRPGS